MKQPLMRRSYQNGGLHDCTCVLRSILLWITKLKVAPWKLQFANIDWAVNVSEELTKVLLCALSFTAGSQGTEAGDSSVGSFGSFSSEKKDSMSNSKFGVKSTTWVFLGVTEGPGRGCDWLVTVALAGMLEDRALDNGWNSVYRPQAQGTRNKYVLLFLFLYVCMLLFFFLWWQLHDFITRLRLDSLKTALSLAALLAQYVCFKLYWRVNLLLMNVCKSSVI